MNKKSPFFVLQVTESWGEPGNKAKQDHSLVIHLSRVCLARKLLRRKLTGLDSGNDEEVLQLPA